MSREELLVLRKKLTEYLNMGFIRVTNLTPFAAFHHLIWPTPMANPQAHDEKILVKKQRIK
jgi:hypothetical protein